MLIIGVDWSTRLLTFLTGHDKSYTATIRFGVSTITDDADGEALIHTDTSLLTDADIAAAVPRLSGDILQTPSTVSAIRVGGERAYTRVRAGEHVVLEPRPVTVTRFDVGPLHRGVDTQAVAWCEAEAIVDVSSGTYVRALARDLGDLVGVGAHLRSLRRTRSGPFTVADSVPLSLLESMGGLGGRLVPPGAAVRRFLPILQVDDDAAERIRHGQRIEAGETTEPVVAIVDPRGGLVAVADASEPRLRLLAVVPTA